MNTIKTLASSSLLISLCILQGCSSDDFANGSASTPDVNRQYNPSSNQNVNQQYNYNQSMQKDVRSMPGDNGASPEYNQNGPIDNSSQQSITLDKNSIPTATNSSDYNRANTVHVVPKQSDIEWVKSQQANGYTIQMGSNPNRAKVAYSLFKGPKSARSAQFGYKDQQQKVYTGVYGSYKTKEEAQKAFDSLPAEVKQSATVQQWQQVQSKASNYVPDEKPSVEAPSINGSTPSSSMEWNKGQ